jgi:hypothetical protein
VEDPAWSAWPAAGRADVVPALVCSFVAGRQRLLVNFVYCHPVGHAIEALHYCHGYRAADPEVEIGLALNAHTPVELAELCPFVGEVYPVFLDLFDTRRPAYGFEAMPTDWDWVVNDGRGYQEIQRQAFPGLGAYYDRADSVFASVGSAIGLAGAPPPPYAPFGEWRLAVPGAARERAAAALAKFGEAGPVIGLLPSGSGPRANYPSLRSWQLILSAFERRWPEAVFCVVGKLRTDGRTATSLGRSELKALLASVSRLVDAVDLDLVDQLAAVEACDVLVSPHSGFGMAGLAVGTPWLTIGGNRWPEYYFNGVPFYSVLPDVALYPAYHEFEPDPAPVEDDGARSPSMSLARLQADLEEIVEGAARLIERRWPFEMAMADYFGRLLALRGGRADRIWSIDGVHLRYLE